LKRPNWDVNLLAPLINTSLTINDLLPDSVLQTNADTSLKLVYNTNILDINMDSLFKIPDTTIANIYNIPVTSVANPGSNFYSDNKNIKLNVSNGVELNKARIESGFIEIEVFSDIKEKIVVKYTIPSATLNGDTLVVNELIPAATSSQQGYLKKIIDISGYDLDLTGTSGSAVNTFITRANGIIDSNATGPVTLVAGDQIIINNKLISIIPSYVKGYFGTQQIHFGPDTTKISAFNKIIAGSVDLNQVSVNLSFQNGFGIDAQLNINQFTSFNTSKNQSVILNHSIINSPININRAQETFTVPEVTYSYYNVAINTSNSNIDQMIELLPNRLVYDMNLNVNPLGNISGNNDFVFKKYPLKTMLNVEFPLSFIANNLTLVDTVNFNLSSQSITGKIVGGNLILYVENGYPFDATISLDLFDANNQYISTLSSAQNIVSAPLDVNLKVANKQSSKVVYPVSVTDVNNLYLAKKMAIKVSFTTAAQPQFIKIYDGYSMDIKAVGDFTYNVDLK